MKKISKILVLSALFLLTPILTACSCSKQDPPEPEHQHNYQNNVCVECLDGAAVYLEEGTTKKYFATLPDAVNAATSATESSAAPENFSKIVLMKDLSGNGVKISNYRKIEFDFAGFTYTLNGQMVGSIGTETNGFQILKDTEVVFKNGTLKQGLAGAKAFIQNYTDIKLDDFVLDATNDQGSVTCLTVLSCNHGNSVVTGDSNIIAPQGQTGVALNYGNLSAYRAKGVQLTFDENFTGTVSGEIQYNNCTTLPNWTQKTVLTIKSGTFNIDGINDDAAIDENIQIVGGTFNQNVGKYCADYYECYQDSNIYKVRLVDAENVVCYVEVDNARRYFNTIDEAINEITQNVESTIVLMKDLSVFESYIGDNKNITFDLNNHSITANKHISVQKNNNIAFKNGTLNNISFVSFGNLEFENCIISSDEEIGIIQHSGIVTYKGETDILGNDWAMDVEYNPNEYGPSDIPTVIFDEGFSGTVEGAIGLCVDADYIESKINLIIHGGTFLNFGDLTDCDVQIYGGVFYNFDFYLGACGGVVVHGGVFDKDVTEICADTLAAEKGTTQIEVDGQMVDKTIYTVKKGSMYYYDSNLERNLYYATPQEAIAAINPDIRTTIYCLKDIYYRGFAVEGKEIVFDLQGHEYVITTSSVFKTLKSARVTIKNGTIKPYKQKSLKTMFQIYAGITLDNVDIYGTNDTYGGIAANILDCFYGTINISGNSNLIASNGNGVIKMYWGLAGNYKKGMTININDSNIAGKITYDADSRYTGSYDWVSVTKLNMNSGTYNIEIINVYSVDNMSIYTKGGNYNQDMSEYCPNGYACIKIEDRYEVSRVE